MTLAEWAARWNVSQAAINELCESCLYDAELDPDEGTHTEAYNQSQVRLEAPQKGCYLFRNNVGAGKLEAGNFVRFGLANDSKNTNEVLKSADLIGIRRRLITAQDVGCYIGQFLSREIKATGWKFTGTQKEMAQLKWAALINAQGGDAKIVTGPGSL
jgi:hypothetical protein